MMDISTEDIWAEIDEAIGYDDIPENAVTVRDVMMHKGITEAIARRAMEKLEEKGWKTGKSGNRRYWWPGG
jgi:L-amino acid N-acyltransferase YncA